MDSEDTLAPAPMGFLMNYCLFLLRLIPRPECVAEHERDSFVPNPVPGLSAPAPCFGAHLLASKYPATPLPAPVPQNISTAPTTWIESP